MKIEYIILQLFFLYLIHAAAIKIFALVYL